MEGRDAYSWPLAEASVSCAPNLFHEGERPAKPVGTEPRSLGDENDAAFTQQYFRAASR